MTQYLPPNLLALFAPRDPIPFLPPIEKHKHHRKLPYTGVAQFLGEFEDPSETPAPARIETREERKERKRREKQEQANYKLEQDLALWNPKKNPNATGNPYNTLFVARLNYDTSEHKLRREFDISMIKDIATGKPRGYAFVEFEHERDMHAANKDANNRKIDGHRILTDIERGRTRPDWRPRRLGKGLETIVMGSAAEDQAEIHSEGTATEKDIEEAGPASTETSASGAVVVSTEDEAQTGRGNRVAVVVVIAIGAMIWPSMLKRIICV
ncbi:U1 small nuclear ribonucleoprotein 70 kDa [Sparganum proliferum]